MLLDIYRRQGDTKKQTDLLYGRFRAIHSIDTLQALLDVIGNDKREDVIFDEVTRILESATLRTSDAEFLIAVGKVDEAESYLLKRADLFKGDSYDSLLSLAEAMASESRHLAVSLIFRSLLVSILG